METLKSILTKNSNCSLSNSKIKNSNEDYLSKYDNDDDIFLFI